MIQVSIIVEHSRITIEVGIIYIKRVTDIRKLFINHILTRLYNKKYYALRTIS